MRTMEFGYYGIKFLDNSALNCWLVVKNMNDCWLQFTRSLAPSMQEIPEIVRRRDNPPNIITTLSKQMPQSSNKKSHNFAWSRLR